MKKTRQYAACLAVLLAASLTSCATPQPQVTPTKIATPRQTTSPQAKLDKYYHQKLQWEKCDQNFECANLEVPIDYTHPEAQTAKIAMKRLKTPNQNKLGTLVMNPGGPGGSGTETMKADAVDYFFTKPIQENYDILSFDPRGVNRSQPAIKCRTNQELDEDNAKYIDTSTPGGRTENIAEIKLLGQRCLRRSPEMTRFASTENAARDLDIMRAALGEERLNYLGYSYGTYLGSIYADMFPNRVGRFILDGVLDASANLNQVAAMQAGGFENSLREFSRECQQYHAKQCPLRGGTEAGLGQIKTLLESLTTSPLSTSTNRELTAPLGFTGIIGSLYNQTSWWQTLMPALSSAIKDNDGTALLASADFYNSRNSDGTYQDNSSDAFVVINALDYVPVGNLEQWEKEAKQLQAEYPTVAKFFSYPSLGADQWPVSANSTAKRHIDPQLDGDILLVGTTGDPATPYQMAQNVHKMITHSKLLTVQGWNHTSYNSSAPTCVTNIGDTYLLTGKVPEKIHSPFCSIS